MKMTREYLLIIILKNETKVFQNANEKEITEKLMEFINEVNTKIETDETAYANVSRYDPLVAGTYMPLPKKLQDKKAIINVHYLHLQFELSASITGCTCEKSSKESLEAHRETHKKSSETRLGRRGCIHTNTWMGGSGSATPNCPPKACSTAR